MAQEATNTQRQTDAIALLDALSLVTTPVIINVGEIANQRNAKLNTVQKQFNTIKNRHGLNIQITSVKASSPAAAPRKARKSAADKVVKSSPAPKKAASPKVSKKKQVALEEIVKKVAEDDEGEEDDHEAKRSVEEMIIDSLKGESEEDDGVEPNPKQKAEHADIVYKSNWTHINPRA